MNAEKSGVMVSERDGRMMVKIVDINIKELQQVDGFKYLGTVVAKEGGTMTAVNTKHLDKLAVGNAGSRNRQ